MEDFINKVKLARENAVKGFEEKGQPAIEEWLKNAQKGVQQFGKEINDSIQREKDRAGGLVDPIARGPPSEAELNQLDMCYVTERVIATSFPVDGRLPKHTLPKNLPNKGKWNSLAVLSAHLRHKHGGKFMVWNVSEESYDYSVFNNQVLVFSFPGYPSPPLGMLFNICTSIESWLAADEENVAVIHCLNGMGRTAIIISCFLAWVGHTPSPQYGLEWMADCKVIPIDKLTVPSQRRYLQYFSDVLDGQRPSDQTLILKHVIMNSVPIFFEMPNLNGRQQTTGENQQQQQPICRPYLQLFKDGTLLFSSAPSIEEARRTNSNDEVKQKERTGSSHDHQPAQCVIQPQWIYKSDGSISFRMDFPLCGNILLRGRHVESSGRRVSMFRSAFHTGYISSGVLRLTKSELDGANVDPRFDEDFFIDLVFGVAENNGCPEGNVLSPDAATNQQKRITSSPRVKKKFSMMDSPASDTYDAMLFKDKQFWEGVQERKARRLKAAQQNSNASKFSPKLNLQQSRKGFEEILTHSPAGAATVAGAGAAINHKRIIEQEHPMSPAPTCNKFRINAEVDEIAANLTDYEATDRDRNLLAELAALEELEIGPHNSVGDNEINQIPVHMAVSSSGNVADPDCVAQMTSPILKTDGAAAAVVDEGNKREQQVQLRSPCSSEDAMLSIDSVLNSRELDELKQELSNAISLERPLSGIEPNDDDSIAELDDSINEQPDLDLDGDILKELESCLEGIKADNVTD